jgi:hypothetical protein
LVGRSAASDRRGLRPGGGFWPDLKKKITKMALRKNFAKSAKIFASMQPDVSIL